MTPRRVSRVLPAIDGLDPAEDAAHVGRLSAGIDFPWDTRRAYELALLKTFAVPRDARRLVATGEFLQRTAKRFDDTVAVVATLGLEGLDAPAGRAALRAMNRAHAPHAIPGEAYRYTLALFVLEPIRWNARFGWRRLTDVERLASFHFWREVGRRMAIPDLPDTLEALIDEADAFEAREVRYDPANRALLDATLGEVLRRAPGGAWTRGPVARRAAAWSVAALVGPRHRDALGLPRPPAGWTSALEAGLRARAAVQRRLPARRDVAPVPPLPTYPDGIDWTRVGPEGAGARGAR
ncbi:MAG: oxygenase MpaB family protein [Trueperaceae bacterium]|nr:oxygenase MpaB family protein [Trueperaceae bacterium]